MTHQPLTKAERDELRRMHNAATPAPWSGDWDIVTDDGDPIARTDASLASDPSVADCNGPLIAAARNALPRLLNDLDAADADARELRDILRRHNFAPCDTAACNCNGWHERSTGNGFYARFREIEEAVGDHNGKTLLDAVQEIMAQRDRAESERATAESIAAQATARMEEMRADRDALKAKLAALASDLRRMLNGTNLPTMCVSKQLLTQAVIEPAESAIGGYQGEVAELRGKLAALVEAAEPFACDQGCDAVHHPVKDRHDQRDNCPVVARLCSAIAAARGAS